MKKYCYNMGWGLNEYSLKEIAFDLDVDSSYLQKLLDENNDDIANCIGKAIADKKKKELFKSIIDVYSTDYLLENNLDDICNNEILISMDKEKSEKNLDQELLDCITRNKMLDYVMKDMKDLTDQTTIRTFMDVMNYIRWEFNNIESKFKNISNTDDTAGENK